MAKWFERKFLMMIVGVIINVLQEQLGLPVEVVQWITILITGWIGGEAAVDAVKTFKNPPVGPNPDDVAAGFHDPKVPKKGFADPK